MIDHTKNRGARCFLASVLTLFVLAIANGFAADISAGFDSANKLYEEGKFSDAASAYENLVHSGTVSPALYFNLGNAYFKSGQLGRAVAAYRNAQRLSPRDPEVRANLQFVRGQVQGSTLLPTGAQRWLASLTVNEWAKLAAAILWLWFGVLVLLQLRPALKQSLWNFVWLGGLATLIVGGCLVMAWANASAPCAIVVAHDVVIHNGPLDEAPQGTTVHDGAEVSVIDTKNDWLQVRVDGNRTGWLRRDQVVLASGV